MAGARRIKTLIKILVGVVLVSFLYFFNRDEVSGQSDLPLITERKIHKHTHSPIVVANSNNQSAMSSSVMHKVQESNVEKTITQATENTSAKELSSSSKHGLSVHVWDNMCGGVVNNLREHPLFPSYPDSTSLSCLKLLANEKRNVEDYGLRQFGILSPQLSGNYEFAIYSDDTSELWLSSSENQEDLKLIASVAENKGIGWTNEGNINKYRSQKSPSVYLEAGKKYFIEVLFKQMKLLDHYGVLWKSPGRNDFTDIPCELLSSTADKQYGAHKNRAHQISSGTAYRGKEEETVHFNRLPFIADALIQDILPYCDYVPSYLVKRKLRRYEGVSQPAVHNMNSETYPPDETDQYIQICNHKSALSIFDCMGNRKLIAKKAILVSSAVMEALNAKAGRESYTLKNIFNVEARLDDEKGERFLLDLELVDSKNRSVRFSEYVFKPRGSSSLCYPKMYRWNKNATVNIISTARKQPGWVQHLINTVANVQRQINDKNIKLIISDWGNGDLDLEDTLKKSGLMKYQVIKKSGKFHKTEAIQEAAAQVTDPDDIVFQLDLHLDIPVNIFDYVRKHCIPGKMVVTPVVMRLMCGHFPTNPAGHWETMGYGLFGVLKKDWDNIGGMNIKDFRNTWGGEDWELCDRTLMKGYEIERLRLPGLHHYYHDHKHLWDGKTKNKEAKKR